LYASVVVVNKQGKGNNMDALAYNHLYSSQPAVQDICSPLFDSSDIDFFNYVRVYDDNSLSILSTFPKIHEDGLKKKTIITSGQISALMAANMPINEIENSFYYLLKEGNPRANGILKEYAIGNAIVLAFRKPGFYECFSFLAKANKNIVNFYFNNWDVLIKFRHYFLDKASSLIDEAEKAKLIMDYGDKNNNSVIRGAKMPFDREKFEATVKPRHYRIFHDTREVKITAREFDTLKCLAQGRTNKEAGKILNVSPKTIDVYQIRLREKLHVHRKSDLINIYLASDLVAL